MVPQKKPISWVWIGLAFFLFWPVGIILMLVRFSSDRSATMTCGKPLRTTSIILFSLGALLLIIGITDDYEFISPAIALLVGGIIVFLLSARTRKRGKRYKQYIDLIVNQSHSSIDAIASFVGVTYQIAEADLRRMISAGYFQGATIDSNQRKIVMPIHPPVLQQPAAVGTPIPQQATPQVRVISCKNCGANNTVVGQLAECEYCGSTLL